MIEREEGGGMIATSFEKACLRWCKEVVQGRR